MLETNEKVVKKGNVMGEDAGKSAQLGCTGTQLKGCTGTECRGGRGCVDNRRRGEREEKREVYRRTRGVEAGGARSSAVRVI